MVWIAKGLLWTGVYLTLVLAPLLVLLIGPLPAGSGFWGDFSVALGFAGTAMMGVMFVLTARFRRAMMPFGIDIVYYFHRQVALVACAFILAHPVIFLLTDPALLPLLHPAVAPGHLLAASAATVALIALMVTSLWRKNLDLDYDLWRRLHAVLAVAALALALAHIVGVANYSAAPWKRLLWSGIGGGWIALLLYVRLVKPAVMLRHPYRVIQVSQERGQAWSLTVQADGHAGMTFAPGQFAWLTLGHSPFALKEHPFSIASSALHPAAITFTIKEAGDFTRQIKNTPLGQQVYLDGPYGSFSCDRHASPGLVFVAGGIGIAPLMGMLRTLADRRDARPILLFYAYNTWERLTFREELAELEERLKLRTILILNDPPETWTGERGLLRQELLRRYLPDGSQRWDYYICGPVPMIKVTEAALHRCGVPLSHLHSELFDLV